MLVQVSDAKDLTWYKVKVSQTTLQSNEVLELANVSALRSAAIGSLNQDTHQLFCCTDTGTCRFYDLIVVAGHDDSASGPDDQCWTWHPPIPTTPAYSCDSPDSVALQYDQPVNFQFNYNIPGYACTQHPWVLEQHSQGLTDCHFVLDYDIEFKGMDTSYTRQPVPYYEAFKHCESVNCVGLQSHQRRSASAGQLKLCD
ncbi:hypothetical protein Pmani_002055 [Petrolisthes manimaculis]|uniref:Uncharacterized protein n=1 Tax=Petrolisthes manimaculis TaxID=1843537 RepID=A0AAE1UQX4_9EUCA|nr:hypothetical protein Pmani_002055 [Petrolisthes manimaculis]